MQPLPNSEAIPMPPGGMRGMPPNQSDPKAQQAMQMMNRMTTQIRQQMDAESLVKPHSQVILDESIIWHWELPGARSIKGVLDKATKEYSIYFEGSWASVNSNDAIVIGATITSAARWETLWKQYAGEYLVGNPYDAEKVDVDGFEQ